MAAEHQGVCSSGACVHRGYWKDTSCLILGCKWRGCNGNLSLFRPFHTFLSFIPDIHFFRPFHFFVLICSAFASLSSVSTYFFSQFCPSVYCLHILGSFWSFEPLLTDGRWQIRQLWGHKALIVSCIQRFGDVTWRGGYYIPACVLHSFFCDVWYSSLLQPELLCCLLALYKLSPPLLTTTPSRRLFPSVRTRLLHCPPFLLLRVTVPHLFPHIRAGILYCDSFHLPCSSHTTSASNAQPL